MIYNIFGKNIKIECEDKKIERILYNWVKKYPLGFEENIEINIRFVNNLPNFKGIFYNSPTNYLVYDNINIMKIAKHEIIFEKDKNILNIYVKYKYKTNYIKNFILKFISIGYFNSLENVGAFFYEMILVFMQYILNDKMLIHASAMKNLNTNKVILFGGSGGVGKTSLELLLCNKLNYSFIADDISVVDKDGYIYPNLAYPKIYAYNTIKNTNIKNIIFNNRKLLDKIQWIFMRKIRGDKGVRRAIFPFELYKNVEIQKNIITSYYILQKTNKVQKITISKLDKKTTAYATYIIIKNEYGNATIHFGWSEYNTLFHEAINPIIKLDTVYEQWKLNYERLFSNVNTYLVEIPIDIKYSEFMSFFEKYFENNNE